MQLMNPMKIMLPTQTSNEHRCNHKQHLHTSLVHTKKLKQNHKP